MDGEVITAMRTAAVSAIATKYLAEKYEILAVLGSGVKATAHTEAFCKMFPIKKVHTISCLFKNKKLSYCLIGQYLEPSNRRRRKACKIRKRIARI